MRAALRGGDQVHIRLCDHLAALRQPLYRPIYRLRTAFKMGRKRLLWNHRAIDCGISEVVCNPVLVIPLGRFFFLFVRQRHPQTWAQHRLCAKRMAQLGHRKSRRVKITGIWFETNARSRIALATTT